MAKPLMVLEGQETVNPPQLSLAKTAFMFAWPAAWFVLLAYVLAQPLVPDGGVVPTWVFLSIVALGGGAEGAVGLVLLHREGYELNLGALRDRIRWCWPRGWKAWGTAALVLIAGLTLSMAMEPLNAALATVPGFTPPPWWPAASNPLIEISSSADIFPDVNLVGNFGFVFLYLVIGLVFNIFGEELYYRGYLLPRMRGVFGRWDWVANGIGFMLKHVYMRWLYPGVLMGGMAFAFAFGPLGSLPLAVAYHWIGNYLFQVVVLTLGALGIG